MRLIEAERADRHQQRAERGGAIQNGGEPQRAVAELCHHQQQDLHNNADRQMLAADALDPAGRLDCLWQQVRILAREQDIGVKPLVALLRNHAGVQICGRVLRMCRAAAVIIQQQFPVAQVIDLLRQDLLFLLSAAFAIEMVCLEFLCVLGNGVVAGVAEERDRMHAQRTQLFERGLRIRLHNFLQQDLACILLTDGYIDHIAVGQVRVRDVHTLEDHQLSCADANTGRFNIDLHTALGNIHARERYCVRMGPL